MLLLDTYFKYQYFSSLNEMTLFKIVYVKLILGFGIPYSKFECLLSTN